MRVLIAYASEFGSTAGVAEAIGDVLRDAGATVDVQPVVNVHDLSQYQAAIVGSAVYNGAWLPEAAYFVQFHAPQLIHIPVAYFTVCMTVRDDSKEARRSARSFLDPILDAAPQIQPVGSGLFAGRVATDKLPMAVRLRVRLTTKLSKGDYRDWAAIRAWTKSLQPALLNLPPAAD